MTNRKKQEHRRLVLSEDEWQGKLTAEQFFVCRKQATEKAFTGQYYRHFEAGTYHCVCCDSPLFDHQGKYHSGSGWPSFFAPVSEYATIKRLDSSHNMQRTEVMCGVCDAHLGHLFEDGPPPTGLRYCINSVALRFDPQKK